MLKNKKSSYILLPIVVLIWGAILYKTVDAFAITNSIKQVEFDINGMPGLYLIDVISNTGIHKVYKLIKSN